MSTEKLAFPQAETRSCSHEPDGNVAAIASNSCTTTLNPDTQITPHIQQNPHQINLFPETTLQTNTDIIPVTPYQIGAGRPIANSACSATLAVASYFIGVGCVTGNPYLYGFGTAACLTITGAQAYCTAKTANEANHAITSAVAALSAARSNTERNNIYHSYPTVVGGGYANMVTERQRGNTSPTSHQMI